MKKKDIQMALKLIEPILKGLFSVLNSTSIDEFESAVVDYELIVSDLFIEKREQLEKKEINKNDSSIE